MKLLDVIADLRTMSDDELREKVRQIRHTKYVAKPAAAAKKQQAAEQKERKQKAVSGKTIQKQIASMSMEERMKLIEALEGGDNG